PASVKQAFPTKLPPLRSDASTLVVGVMAPIDAGEFRIKVSGTMLAAPQAANVDVVEEIKAPNLDNYFLHGMFDHWKTAKDRPALPTADRALNLDYGQTRLTRAELQVTAEMAMKDLKFEEAARAFEQVKLMAPHDPEPDGGLRILEKMKAGKLSPDAMRKNFE